MLVAIAVFLHNHSSTYHLKHLIEFQTVRDHFFLYGMNCLHILTLRTQIAIDFQWSIQLPMCSWISRQSKDVDCHAPPELIAPKLPIVQRLVHPSVLKWKHHTLSSTHWNMAWFGSAWRYLKLSVDMPFCTREGVWL